MVGLLIFVVIGVLRKLFALGALICIGLGVWYWYNGGREILATKVDASKEQMIAAAGNLVGDERQALETALQDPTKLVDSQKVHVVAILDRLSASPAVTGNQVAVAAIEKLRQQLDQPK